MLGPAQVASCLLILAFFYDIFWVFISSHIFGQNVMVRLPTTKNRNRTRTPNLTRISLSQISGRIGRSRCICERNFNVWEPTTSKHRVSHLEIFMCLDLNSPRIIAGQRLWVDVDDLGLFSAQKQSKFIFPGHTCNV